MPIAETYFIGQIVLAVVLGAVLGYQRERWGKSAGPRTYALVSAGSALFTVLSVHAFGADIARVASQVVVGIGFLGAGTILHKENRVEGLTTAAGLWLVAAVGMAVGVGFYILAIVTTVIMLILFMLNDETWRKRDGKPDDNSQA